MNTSSLPMNFVFGIVVFLLGICKAASYDIDEYQVLEELLSPQENPSIQVRALRRELLKKVQEALDRLDEQDNYQALARWNSLPDKRNLEALARAGYIKTLPEEEEEEDANYKRSIANLAKNGQLPRRPDEQKRGIESLARNGELRLRSIQSILDNMAEKRHLGSVLKTYDGPLASKKSLSSLAKSGDLTYNKHVQYKRSPVPIKQNTGTSAGTNKQSSDNLVSKQKLFTNDKMIEKRGKRSIDYYDENYSPVYDNMYDYDDLITDLHSAYPQVDKRFLGRLPQMGKPKSTPTPKTRRYY